MDEARMNALRDKINSIHLANVLYWRQGNQPNRDARAEHQKRQDRLRAIRVEFTPVRRADDEPVVTLPGHRSGSATLVGRTLGHRS
jgi:hypothetical protein